MGRAKRIHYRGAIYHVISRGNGGQNVFRSAADRLLFLGLIEYEARRADCHVLTYCLMGNHFHLLIRIGDIPLSEVMRRLLCRYARRFNAIHKTRGHLFQSRFKAKLCAKNDYLVTLLRYIHQNPVKEGFVKDPADWPWSSHRQIIGPIRSTLVDVDDTLSLLDDDPDRARARYRQLMGEPLGDFTPEFDASPRLKKSRTPPKLRKPLEELADELEAESGLTFRATPGDCPPRKLTQLRRRFAQEAAGLGYGHSSIAKVLGVYPSAVSQYLNPAPGFESSVSLTPTQTT